MSVFTIARPLRRVGQVPTGIKGATAWLRPLGPGETEPLQAVFDGMSLESRYARYLQGMSVLTPAMTRILTAVDGIDHVAWLATVDGRPAGIARYVTVVPGTADVAFEVADEFHGLGLGAALLDAVTTIAAASGIENLQALVLGSNHQSRRLLAKVGLELVRQSDGSLEADGPFHLFERPRVDRAKVLRLAFAAQPLAA
jgi:GNAT superfamily N-acetyltransferase